MQDIAKMTSIKCSCKKPKVKAFDKRVAIIDFLRGLLILLVVFDHIMYDFRDYLPTIFEELNITSGWFYEWAHSFCIDYSSPNLYFTHPAREIIRNIALGMFVFLSGISCAFSKNNKKRALKMVLFSLLLALVTNLMQGLNHVLELGFYSFAINYNVIAVISTCVLIYAVIENKSPQFYFYFTIGLMVICYFVLPPLCELLKDSPFLFLPFWKPDYIEINGQIYRMVDYMALFPYIIYFFIGVIISKIVYEVPSNHLNHNYKIMKPICFCGRHSLLIYIAHQFVLYGIFIAFIEIVKLF